jgi:hypothetical protein
MARYPPGLPFFCLSPFTMYQKPVIDHCPWPSSQFNKWHAQRINYFLLQLLSWSSPGITPYSHHRRLSQVLCRGLLGKYTMGLNTLQAHSVFAQYITFETPVPHTSEPLSSCSVFRPPPFWVTIGIRVTP